jgi:ABC-type Fe3+/spermidine/putrescine transport system ATPase subunit
VTTGLRSYSLFPFLSVFDNVATGLRNRRLKKREIADRVQLQPLIQNDGACDEIAQGTQVQVFLAPDALRVLPGSGADVLAAEEGPVAVG